MQPGGPMNARVRNHLRCEMAVMVMCRVGSKDGHNIRVGRMDGTFVNPAEGKETMLGVDGGMRG